MTLTTIKYIFQLNALKIALQQLQQNAERAVSIKSASCIAKSASSLFRQKAHKARHEQGL